MSSHLRVLRHKDFRCLFIGQAASVVGDQVVIIALALFVTQSTGSPSDLGLVLGAQSLTLVSLLLFGGQAPHFQQGSPPAFRVPPLRSSMECFTSHSFSAG